MYYNGKTGVHTNSFLNEVHAQVNQKYLSKVTDGDVAQAKLLQDFFQKLKMAAQDLQNLDPIDRGLYGMLLQEINEQLTTKADKKLKTGVSNLFRRYSSVAFLQGDYFERELTAVIQAVAYKVSDGVQIPSVKIRTGQETGTTTLTDDLIAAIKKEMAKGLSEEEAFHNVTSSQGNYQKKVAIKTDVQGVTVDIVAGTDFQLAEIQTLLSQATFSAKSYASQAWNSQTGKMEIIQDLYPNIHLGNSNPYRAVYGALTSLGYSHRTTTSAYSAATNLIKKGVQNTINHIYHLRYLYELTGAGTRTLQGTVKEARFLIYNDPTSDNIYVKSTAEILLDIFQTPPDWNGDPFGGISISKNKFQ